MSHGKLLLGAALLCALSSNSVWAQEDEEAKGPQARVRFFGQAAIAIKFFKNQSCYGGRGIQASKTNLGAMFGNSKSISLGMPETPTVASLQSRDGILFSAFFREYAVRADEPLTIHIAYAETTGRMGYSCKPYGAVFTPEAGQDYEVTVDVGNGLCEFQIKRIEVKDTAVQLLPVLHREAQKCTKDDVLPIAVCKTTLNECKEGVMEKFRATSPEGKPDKAAYAECTAAYKTCAQATK
jgi:hypothetical protein